MSLLSSFVCILLRTKEKMGFKLSEKEDMIILLDDANKLASMILRVWKVRERLQMRIGNEPEIEHGEYVKMSPESSKAKVKLENKNDDEDIRRYIN